jgi:hypothetical protein
MPVVKAVDEHPLIPRDANGDPVFLILPPGVQASYDRKMQNCEAGWRATGDPWAVAEAHTLTTLHRQAPPAWLDDAVWALAVSRRTKAHAKRAREAAIRLMRYEAVRDAHHLDGLSWEEACAQATKVYADNPDVAAEPDRMWKAYKRVKKDLRKGRGGLYFTPKKQRRP